MSVSVDVAVAFPRYSTHSAGPIGERPIQQLHDNFALASDVQAIATRLIDEVDRFAHLGQARFVCLGSQPTVTLRGAQCNAIVTMASVQGPMRRLFDWMVAYFAAPVLDWDEPDFLIIVDAAVWSTLDTVRQERLVFHELCHVVAIENEYGVPKLDNEGRPMLKVVPHDIEYFHGELERYGLAVCGAEDAATSIAAGFRIDQRNTKKIA